jgi:hypothetical protein
MSTYDLLGHIGFGLIGASFLVKDILWLRLISIVANGTIATFNYIVPQEPLWVVIGWSLLFVFINIVQILLAYRERQGVRFNEEEQELYDTLFLAFSPVEFLKLLRVGQWKTVDQEQVLIKAGETVTQLMLVYNGSVTIVQNGEFVAHAKDGAFLGEMGYLTDRPASATVTTNAPTRYLEWPTNQLKALLARNPSMAVALQTVFNQGLIQKIHTQAETKTEQ